MALRVSSCFNLQTKVLPLLKANTVRASIRAHRLGKLYLTAGY